MSTRGAATRERLLAAALALIPEVGWGAVTTRAVAERAGLNSGLVHYHFPTVPDLLTAAALGFCQSFAESWMDLLDGAVDAGDGLTRLVSELDRHPPDEPASRLMAEIILAAPRHPELRDGLAAVITATRARLADWLRAQSVADPEALAALTLVALEGIALHRAIGAATDTAVYLRALAQSPRPEHAKYQHH